MAGTFGGFSSSTYTLTSNPTTITSAGTIDVNSTIVHVAGILGTSGVAWTLTNLGTAESIGSLGTAIDLQSGGLIINGTAASAALIEGSQTGILISGSAGTVSNFGMILGTAANGFGVELLHGGSVNNTGGLIQGYTGVYITGVSGTVTNSGTISGMGSIANRGLPPASVELNAGGAVFNTGSILSPNTVYTVEFGDGGFLSNSQSGYIGSGGIQFLVAGGTLVNAGQIVDADGNGVFIDGTAGTLTNSGTISGQNGGIGVVLAAGGSVTNMGTGLIQGGLGVQIGAVTGAGTVTNSATIIGTGASVGGVGLLDGGSVTNMGTGLIEGASYGVDISGSAGAVTNIGTIIGTSGDGVDLGLGGTVVDSGTISGGFAVRFGDGGNFLEVQQGYKLLGGAYGGTSGHGGIVGVSNTLELSGTVTVNNYNTLGLRNFGNVLFGDNGNETLKATTTTGALGTVTISGFTQTSDIVDLIDLTNGTLTNNGTVSGSDQLTVVGSNGTVTLQLDGQRPHAFHPSPPAAQLSAPKF